nr:RcnB family protein [uncultured Celeribacter sp.]
MPKLTKPILAVLAALTAAPVLATPNGHNNGQGWGVGKIPPGHMKKMMYGRGDRLPDGYVIVRDYDRYRLPRPGNGYDYVRYDDQIYKVARDTATVVSAIGILSDLLN